MSVAPAAPATPTPSSPPGSPAAAPTGGGHFGLRPGMDAPPDRDLTEAAPGCGVPAVEPGLAPGAAALRTERSARAPKPSWLKVKLPGGERYNRIKGRARELKLATVCEEARCPNIGECWSGGTATFMVMGDVCTRGCRFCAVTTRRQGRPLDPDEPRHVAEAIAELDLDYVVVTSVDRDDLPDQGAHHFAACIRMIRQLAPKTKVEVLIPDFRGDLSLLAVVVDAQPDVIAHNVETVEALQGTVRDPRANYQQSLDVLAEVKRLDPARFTKSSLMVGHGETREELTEAMRDMRAVGVDFLTIGQYLQPTQSHLPVRAFLPPADFAALEQEGLQLGFLYVASGPLVRSSYKAAEFFIHRALSERAQGAAPAAPPAQAPIDGLLGPALALHDIAATLEIRP